VLKGIDISNWQGPIQPTVADWIQANLDFIIIGIQDEGTARQQSESLPAIHQEYYMDRPGRALSWLPERARVWLDVEHGCLDSWNLALRALSQVAAANKLLGWYGNRSSFEECLPGFAGKLSGPLWWASWGLPPLTDNEFARSFDGMLVHQVADNPVAHYPELAAFGLMADVDFATDALRP